MFKIAVRNLLRNRWRSVLTLGGIMVATAMLVWTVALMDGWMGQMVKSVTAVELGQVQVHTVGFADRPSVFDSFPHDEAALERIRAIPGVGGAVGRVRSFGLLGDEERGVVARVTGVDAQGERDVSLLADALTDGAWLSDVPPEGPMEIVLGVDLATQLAANIGDEFALMVPDANGTTFGDGVRVVGLLRTGNSMVDRQSAYAHLEQMQFLLALEDRLQEISVRVETFDDSQQIADQIALVLRPETPPEDPDDALLVEPWQDLAPEIATMLELADQSNGITFFIIYLIVGLGLLNTQRMSALERRREFGVLLAIGLSRWKMARMILFETIVLSIVGAVMGAIVGLGISLHHASSGLDMSVFTDHDASFSFLGVTFTERLYFIVTAEAVIAPIVVTFFVAILCGLWPAIQSARLDPPRAISGRT